MSCYKTFRYEKISQYFHYNAYFTRVLRRPLVVENRLLVASQK